MKEILEAIESRIKSPVMGYFMLAFVAVNWKAIFYLVVQEEGVLERIAYFESNTDLTSLLTVPIITSCFISICYPWINYLFLFLCIKPTELKNSLQAQSEHKLLLKKQELEKMRSAILSNAERELIDRAKRDEELDAIKDKEIKERLKAEIDNLRMERGQLVNTDISVSAHDFENPYKLMEIAKDYRDRAEKTPLTNDRSELLERARALEKKAQTIIMREENR